MDKWLHIKNNYSVFPLGDSALLVDFGNVIDENINKAVIHLFQKIKQQLPSYIVDVIPAYSSLSIYYDVLKVKRKNKTIFESVAAEVKVIIDQCEWEESFKGRELNVPVCYAKKYAPDIYLLAKEKNLSIEDVIEEHTSCKYRVYMIGFLPGFPYMGEVSDKICFPRKQQPAQVIAGSVGIAGKQTGVYSMNSPGGWQIIGRTPLKIFDKRAVQPVFFLPGDEVQFYSITEDEFENY